MAVRGRAARSALDLDLHDALGHAAGRREQANGPRGANDSQLRHDAAPAKEASVEAGDGLGGAVDICEAHPDLACAVAVYVARIYGPVLVRTLALDFVGQLRVPVLVLLSVKVSVRVLGSCACGAHSSGLNMFLSSTALLTACGMEEGRNLCADVSA